MSDYTGNPDQRFCPREDHDKARDWFKRTFKKPAEAKLTKAQRRANLRRLVEMVEQRLSEEKNAI